MRPYQRTCIKRPERRGGEGGEGAQIDILAVAGFLGWGGGAEPQLTYWHVLPPCKSPPGVGHVTSTQQQQQQ